MVDMRYTKIDILEVYLHFEYYLIHLVKHHCRRLYVRAENKS